MKVKLVIIVLKLLQSEAIVTCANRINNVPQASLYCIYLDFSRMNQRHVVHNPTLVLTDCTTLFYKNLKRSDGNCRQT